MDEALYRLHAEREETYWWWVAKNRIILHLIERFWPGPADGTLSASEGSVGSTGRTPIAGAQGSVRPRALDIGCGAGGVLAKLSTKFDAIGIDMSPIARDYCHKRGLKALDGSLPDNLLLSDIDATAGFDVIVMSEVIEHIKEDSASVHAAARLLRPSGIMVCTVPAHMWLWSSHDDFNQHQRRYTRAQFGSLFPSDTLKPLVLSYYQLASMPLLIAARAAEKLRTTVTRRPPPEPTVRPLPAPINWTLTRAFEVEKHILPHTRLPCGTSVISVHRRTG